MTFNLITILFFLFGLVVGSFLNVVILRMDELKTILYTRSHCPSCKKVLAWYDLVPFISFVMLRARCRYCGEKISWQYPMVEVGVGLLFAFIHFFFGLSFGAIFYAVIFSILTVILVYDIKTQTVPDVFAWIALGLAVLGGWYFGGFSLASMLIGGLIAGAFLGALVFFSKEKWMGSGDIKIGIILGLLTGYPNVLLALFVSFLLGSIFGIGYIYYKNSKINRDLLKQSLPFAPFLILATLITIVFGNYLLNWYLGSFFKF